MAQKLIGLVGTGLGPEISLRQFKEPRVKLVMMKEGDKLVIFHADGTQTEVFENGEHSVPRQDTIRFRLDGTSKKALCFIVER